MRFKRILPWLIGGAIVFLVYTYGLTRNPPGFYIDESAFAYNAYLISRTGTSEFGVRWPLYFQNFAPPFTTYANPVCIYLLALVNLIVPPSIWLSRFLSSTAIFIAAALFGLLAFRITSRRSIAWIVVVTVLVTPWLYEVGRLYFDSSFYPLALALFLLALYSASRKSAWSWTDTLKIGAALGLVTYTYTIGRLLGPLLALGLVLFISNRRRVFDIARVWVAYGITLIPLAIFNLRHPGILTSRFMLISYVPHETNLFDLISKFLARYFQDLSLLGLLTTGDTNARHHVPGSSGSLLLATFCLFCLGMVLVIVYRRRDRWWLYIIFSALASVAPAALTNDPFHTGRLIAYCVFLLMLTVPALEWLLDENQRETAKASEPVQAKSFSNMSSRQALLLGLLLAMGLQAGYFQYVFWRDGEYRYGAVNEGYKSVFDKAVSFPDRPIYLADGESPDYIHALWYATLEGRNTSEFVHLKWKEKAPPGALVISSEDACLPCEIIMKSDQYMLYRNH